MDKTQEKIRLLSDQKSIVKFEFSNDQYIILYKSGEEFWNATMWSALFLKFLIKVNTRMNLTSDKYFKLEYRPYIAFHKNGIARVQQSIMKQGGVALKLSTDIAVYKLPQPLSKPQIEEWSKSIEVVQQRLDDYFLPGTGATPIYSLLRNLYAEVVVLDRKVNSVNRELYTKRLVDYILDMYEVYNMLTAKGDETENHKFRKQMIALLDKINFIITTSVGDNVLSTRRALRIGKISLDLKNELKK